MSENAARELQDLLAVHSFYTQLLQKHMGEAVPVPQEVLHPSEAGKTGPLKLWLKLLDMAISAPMVRDALKEPPTGETAEAIYRYYILKSSHSETDRDKTDFLGTYLLRNPGPHATRPPAQPGGHSGETYSYMFSQQQAAQFQAEIEAILCEPVPDMAPEHQQLLREFQYLHQEADEFRHFDQLMDSGILQRVRDLKGRFGSSFYHPKVLAASAVYNVFFGKRFDDLFRDAATQIKAFAAKVQQDGGSIMSRVDGDVTVKHLTEVEESDLMKAEYGKAHDQFKKVSTFKKAVDSRRSGRHHAASAAAAAPPPIPAAVAAKNARPPGVQTLAEAPGRGQASNIIEENKVKGVMESIRNFVHAADTKGANIIPMRNGNVVLTPLELEAFKATYTMEKSFRADFVNLVAHMVALHTRMHHEMEDYKSKRSSSYLWKPHADSLTYLITAGHKSVEEAGNLAVIAEQRGLGDKVKSLQVSMEKLKAQINVVATLLQAS